MTQKLRNESYIGKATEQKRSSRKLARIPINGPKPPEMTYRTSTDATIVDAWCNRMVAKEYYFHSSALAGKQINEEMLQQTIPNSLQLR